MIFLPLIISMICFFGAQKLALSGVAACRHRQKVTKSGLMLNSFLHLVCLGSRISDDIQRLGQTEVTGVWTPYCQMVQ